MSARADSPSMDWRNPKNSASLGMGLIIIGGLAMVLTMILPGEGTTIAVLGITVSVALLCGVLLLLAAGVLRAFWHPPTHAAQPRPEFHLRPTPYVALALVSLPFTWAFWPLGPVAGLLLVSWGSYLGRRMTPTAAARDVPGWAMFASFAFGMACAFLFGSLGPSEGFHDMFVTYGAIGLLAGMVAATVGGWTARTGIPGRLVLGLLAVFGAVMAVPTLWFSIAFSGADLA
jgi:hypothetical protein